MSSTPLPSHDAPPSAPDEARWAAVAARDLRYDGSFVYAVVTTGVYCRPAETEERAFSCDLGGRRSCGIPPLQAL
jgi:AraC family transcriptional regulator, regulatory protein of adaptative response / methylated-DNA-[protein]-cysteine methyltransferase